MFCDLVLHSFVGVDMLGNEPLAKSVCDQHDVFVEVIRRRLWESYKAQKQSTEAELCAARVGNRSQWPRQRDRFCCSRAQLVWRSN